MRTSMVLTAFFLATLPGAFASGQNDVLNGHQLACEWKNSLYGTQKTAYRFFTAPSGAATVEVTSSGGISNGVLFAGYVYSSGRLTVSLPSSDVTYELAHPASIARQFQSCVSPGQPDGDSRPTCELTNENCLLD